MEQNIFRPGLPLNRECFEHHTAWDELLCTIEDELEEAGVSKSSVRGLAAYLYSAYCGRIPLLLAGPNGRDIADAFSSALFGRTASLLCCENGYDSKAIETCMRDGGSIVALLNPLNANWINHFPLLTAGKEKFIIAVQPFAEDLWVEPRSLYHYVLPVLTEPFVDQTASRNFTGGCICEDFQEHPPTTPQKSVPLAAKLSMPILAQNRLRQILADIKVLSGNDCADYDFLFGALPYSYVTGQIEKFQEEVQNGSLLSRNTKELLLTFLGDTE